MRPYVRIAFSCLFLGLVLAGTSIVHASAQLIVDLQTFTEGSSNPDDYQIVGDTLFFIAEDDDAGRELWRFDAGGVAPERVTDIVAGPDDSVEDIVGFRSGVLLIADGALWVSDGTSSGTARILEFPANLTLESELYAAGDFGYFVASAAISGSELFVTDGTPEGTSILIDALPGSGSSAPGQLTPFGNNLLFVAGAPQIGRELWITNGTEAGTAPVINLRPGTVGAQISSLTNVGAVALFSASDGTNSGLFRTDGTPGGTLFVKELPFLDADARPTDFQNGSGNLVYFRADGGLWVTDGEEVTTVEVDLQLDDVTAFAPVGTDVIVQGTLGGASRLYLSDGVTAGVPPVLLDDPSVQQLTTVEDKVFFWADAAPEGFEPWSSDGTIPGTTPVGDINPTGDAADPLEPPPFIGFDGHAIFAARTDDAGNEPWQVELTTGTLDFFAGAQINDVTPSSDARLFSRLGDFLFFASNDSDLGPGWFRTDLVGGPLERVFEQPVEKIVAQTDTILWFTSRIGANGALWRMRADGVPELVNSYTNLEEGREVSDGDLYQGVLIFRGQDEFGNELWTDDGVTAQRLVDIDPGPDSSFPDEFTFVIQRDGVFFSANDGRGLFFSDGTVENTVLTKASINPEQLIFATDLVAFSADANGLGREPWLSDGATTQPIADVIPGPSDSNPEQFVSDDITQVLWFIVKPANGEEALYITDGTPEGTFLMRNFTENGETNPRDMVLFGATLYFTVDDPEIGAELWRSDGTPETTVPFLDLFPGPDDGRVDKGAISSLVVNDLLYFSGTDGVTTDLWVTDGTVEGTMPVGGFSGTNTAVVREISQADGTVFFQGNDPLTGFEPYYLPETWFADLDGDGQGDPGNFSLNPLRPAGFILDGSDCDDTNADVFAGAPEICDMLRNDCLAEDYPAVLDTDFDTVEDVCDNCIDIANLDQADADVDGFGDVCDICPDLFGADPDDDGLCPDVDNCPDVRNAAQQDFDNDGEGNACDPNDGLVQIITIAVDDDGFIATWPVEPGVLGYNLYRGFVSALDGVDFGTCLAEQLPTAQVPLNDAAPAPGQAFFYLVSAFSVLGEGPLGFDSVGVERPNGASCFQQP